MKKIVTKRSYIKNIIATKIVGRNIKNIIATKIVGRNMQKQHMPKSLQKLKIVMNCNINKEIEMKVNV
jgi:hypothetical protein